MPRRKAETAIPKRGKNGRSATGKQRLRTLDDLDKRAASTRAIMATRERILRDLGAEPSAMAMEVVNAACVLSAMLQDATAAYLAGEPVDKLAFGTLAGHQRRLLADLGYSRVPRDVTPDLEDLMGKAVAA